MSGARRILFLLLLVSIAFNVWLLAKRPGREVKKIEKAVEEAATDPRDLIDSVERDWLRRAGFTAPAESLRADLMRHPELIPSEGVVGGTMAFRREGFTLLPGQHVWAIADDGHIETSLLLRYNLRSDTTVAWSVVYSQTEP